MTLIADLGRRSGPGRELTRGSGCVRERLAAEAAGTVGTVPWGDDGSSVEAAAAGGAGHVRRWEGRQRGACWGWGFHVQRESALQPKLPMRSESGTGSGVWRAFGAFTRVSERPPGRARGTWAVRLDPKMDRPSLHSLRY